MTKYFVTPAGDYIGAFDVPDDALADLLPVDAVEVAVPPEHGDQKWDGIRWLPLPPSLPEPLPLSQRLLNALKAKGLLTDADV